MTYFSLLLLLAYLLMLLGLIGSLLPVVPGPPLIWLGILIWAWADGFQRIGAPTLFVLAVLMIVGWGADLLLTTWTSRRAGVSWRSLGAAIAGGFVGGILLSAIPLLGTILGTLAGAVGGLLLMEYTEKQDWPQAWAGVQAYVTGFFAGVLISGLVSLIMLSLFAWQAFL